MILKEVLNMKRLRMFVVCGNIAGFGGTLAEWIIKGKLRPLTIVLTAFCAAMLLAFYKEELKELLEKIRGNNDDDFRGGGSFG